MHLVPTIVAAFCFYLPMTTKDIKISLINQHAMTKIENSYNPITNNVEHQYIAELEKGIHKLWNKESKVPRNP